jgi:hypothetical protein
VTTGSGSDSIFFTHLTALTVTDFSAGDAGDVLEISALLSRLVGWDATTNPFDEAFLRVEQAGADALLQIDVDGSMPGSTWFTVATLQGVDAGDLTGANFAPALSLI